MKMKLPLRLIYLGLLLLFLFIFILAARMAYHTPYSGRAYVEYGVAPVYSRVAGNIEEILCRNGERVEKGQLLFRLDDRNFKAEVQRLEALYESTDNKLKSLDSQIQEEEQQLHKQKLLSEQRRIDFERDRGLVEKKAISHKAYEETLLAYDTARTELAALNRRLESLRLERGAPGPENSELRRIRAELDIARNKLEDTGIRAPISGAVSFHQLYTGQMISINERYAVVQDTGDFIVNADLMERSAGRLQTGQIALVTFDAIPGRVFKARVKSLVRELRSGYVAPNEFHQIEEETRWIRAVGRTRVRFELTESLPAGSNLTSGSKAAVALLKPGFPLLNTLTRNWVAIVSGCNYIY